MASSPSWQIKVLRDFIDFYFCWHIRILSANLIVGIPVVLCQL